MEIIKNIKSGGGLYNYNGDIVPLWWTLEFNNGDCIEIIWNDDKNEYALWYLLEEYEDYKKWNYNKWYYLNLFHKHRKEFFKKIMYGGHEDLKNILSFFEFFIYKNFKKEHVDIILKKYGLNGKFYKEMFWKN